MFGIRCKHAIRHVHLTLASRLAENITPSEHVDSIRKYVAHERASQP